MPFSTCSSVIRLLDHVVFYFRSFIALYIQEEHDGKSAIKLKEHARG